jgi:hypothetical protein
MLHIAFGHRGEISRNYGGERYVDTVTVVRAAGVTGPKRAGG